MYLLPGMLSPLTWTTTLMPTAYALRPPPGADARRGFTVPLGPLSLYLALQEHSAMQPVRNNLIQSNIFPMCFCKMVCLFIPDLLKQV